MKIDPYADKKNIYRCTFRTSGRSGEGGMRVNGRRKGGRLWIHMSSGFHKLGDYREEFDVSTGDRLMSSLTRRVYSIVRIQIGEESFAELELFVKEEASPGA